MLNLVFSFVFITFILLVNSFLSGKLVKKMNPNLNNYMATAYGFLIITSVIFFISSLLYISHSSVLVYLIFLLVIQIVLIILYARNYHLIFITWKIALKPAVIFTTILILLGTCLAIIMFYGYHNTTLSNSEFQYFYSHIQNIDSYSSSPIFYNNGNFTFTIFSTFNIISPIVKVLFVVSNKFNSIYYFYCYFAIFIIMFSCAITGFFYKKIKESSLFFMPILILFSIAMVLFSFLFDETTSIGITWVSIPILCYCHHVFQSYKFDNKYYVIILLIIMFSLPSLDIKMVLVMILLLLFNLIYASLNNIDPLGQLLVLVGPFFYVFFMWIPMFTAIPYIILLTLCILLSIILYLINQNKVIGIVKSKINSFLARHALGLIILVFSIFIILSLFLLVSTFHYQLNWQAWPNTLPNVIFGVHINWKYFNDAFNIFWFVILVIILISFFVLKFVKKNTITNLSLLFMPTFMILLFMNPLCLNLFLKLNQDRVNFFDTGLINFLIIVPIFLWMIQQISRIKCFNTNKGLIYE